jgi:hypothetical protein
MPARNTTKAAFTGSTSFTKSRSIPLQYGPERSKPEDGRYAQHYAHTPVGMETQLREQELSVFIGELVIARIFKRSSPIELSVFVAIHWDDRLKIFSVWISQRVTVNLIDVRAYPQLVNELFVRHVSLSFSGEPTGRPRPLVSSGPSWEPEGPGVHQPPEVPSAFS